MSFQFWGQSSMGIPQMESLPPYYILSTRFFLLSLLLQIIFFFLFSYVIIFSFYRAFKKVTNPYVYESVEIEEQIIDKDKELTPGENIKETEEARIKDKKSRGLVDQKHEVKNFEDDDDDNSENKESENGDKDSNSGDESGSEESKSDKSDEEEEVKNESEQQIATKIKLFGYQESLLKLAPWCFVFVYTLNSFTLDYISLVGIFITIVTYLIFNMFNVAESRPMLKNIFMVGIVAGFVPYIINKQDFTA